MAAHNKKPPSPEDLLSVDQAADVAKVSKSYLNHGRRDGYGPVFIKFQSSGNPKSGRVKYRRSDIEEWLAAQVRQAGDRRYE